MVSRGPGCALHFLPCGAFCTKTYLLEALGPRGLCVWREFCRPSSSLSLFLMLIIQTFHFLSDTCAHFFSFLSDTFHLWPLSKTRFSQSFTLCVRFSHWTQESDPGGQTPGPALGISAAARRAVPSRAIAYLPMKMIISISINEMGIMTVSSSPSQFPAHSKHSARRCLICINIPVIML